MVDLQVGGARFDEIEAMVRAAGHYVRASDDLRPRVLEAARLQYHESRARRRIGRIALCVCLLAITTATSGPNRDAQETRSSKLLVAAGLDNLFAPKSVAPAGGVDGDWRMLDAFTELRRQQARLLGFTM